MYCSLSLVHRKSRSRGFVGLEYRYRLSAHMSESPCSILKTIDRD
jgi:hypothetical protein